MPLIINKNLDIQGQRVEMKRPLDFRYGPWDTMEDAIFWLDNADEFNDRTYYGLTIGIKVYDNTTPTKVIGVDDWWWQPNCVYDSTTQTYVDGFVRKYPANTPYTVEKDETTGKILGISSETRDYGTDWRDNVAEAEVQWNILGGRGGMDTYEDVNSLSPP